VSSKNRVTMTVNQFMLQCALFGFQTSDQFRLMVNGFRAGGHIPIIRVTEDSHVWTIDGAVPDGAYVSITKLYMEAAEERYAEIARLHERFEKVLEKSFASPEIGHTPFGVDGITSDGNHVSGVLPCWTGVKFVKNEDPTTFAYGEYVLSNKRELYPIMQVGDTKKVVPAMTRPSMSSYDDCFICSSIAADGSEMRCQQAIDDTYAQQVASMEEQIELCYSERRSEMVRAKLKTQTVGQSYVTNFRAELERELAILFPAEAGLKQASRQAANLRYKIEDIDVAIDYCSNKSIAEIKKDRFNPLVGALGYTIGDMQKDKKTKKLFTVDFDYAMSELARKKTQLSEKLAKVNRLESLQA